MSAVDGEQAGRIARAFVTARAAAQGLPDYPGPMPATLDDGYRVQDAALALVDDPVAGWKVGRFRPALDGVERLAGPIFAGTVVAAGAEPARMPVFAQGFAAAEAEFLLRIGAEAPAGQTEFTADEAALLIDAVHVGIEIASSPFPGINAHGAPVTISDFGNNHGLVVGAALADWRRAELDDWPVSLLINGAVAGEATAAGMPGGPVGAARFLFGALARRGIALRPGQWISSGAVTGVHPVAVGDMVEARFGSGYTVRCTIAAA